MQDYSIVYICLGSNEGVREEHLLKARQALVQLGEITQESALYESEPWGVSDQPWFINQVLVLTTGLSARFFLERILQIELELGRVRLQKWGQRIIDIDILFFGDQVIKEEDLLIPHPGIAERRFNLLPLSELSPQLVHPVLQKNIAELLKDCTDELTVRKI